MRHNKSAGILRLVREGRVKATNNNIEVVFLDLEINKKKITTTESLILAQDER